MPIIETIQDYLSARLSPFNVDEGTLTEIAKEIGSFCGVQQMKQYRVEFINEAGDLDSTIIFSESETAVYGRFYKAPSNAKAKYIKTIPIE